MTLFESAILGIGNGIAKGVLKRWMGSDYPISSAVSSSLIDLLKGATGDLLASRQANRQFEAIAERTAKNILDLLEAEGDPVDDDLRKRVLKVTGQAVNEGVAEPSELIARDLDPYKLKVWFLQQKSAQTALTELDAFGQEIVDMVLSEAAQYIIDIAAQLPGFTERGLAEILFRERRSYKTHRDSIRYVSAIRVGSHRPGDWAPTGHPTRWYCAGFHTPASTNQ